jgi:hypothetical protein
MAIICRCDECGKEAVYDHTRFEFRKSCLSTLIMPERKELRQNIHFLRRFQRSIYLKLRIILRSVVDILLKYLIMDKSIHLWISLLGL